MNMKVCFAGPLKKFAGCSSAIVELGTVENVASIVKKTTETTTRELKEALMDENEVVRPSVLLFVDNELALRDASLEISPKTDLLLTTLLSGG